MIHKGLCMLLLGSAAAVPSRCVQSDPLDPDYAPVCGPGLECKGPRCVRLQEPRSQGVCIGPKFGDKLFPPSSYKGRPGECCDELASCLPGLRCAWVQRGKKRNKLAFQIGVCKKVVQDGESCGNELEVCEQASSSCRDPRTCQTVKGGAPGICFNVAANNNDEFGRSAGVCCVTDYHCLSGLLCTPGPNGSRCQPSTPPASSSSASLSASSSLSSTPSSSGSTRPGAVPPKMPSIPGQTPQIPPKIPTVVPPRVPPTTAHTPAQTWTGKWASKGIVVPTNPPTSPVTATPTTPPSAPPSRPPTPEFMFPLKEDSAGWAALVGYAPWELPNLLDQFDMTKIQQGLDGACEKFHKGSSPAYTQQITNRLVVNLPDVNDSGGAIFAKCSSNMECYDTNTWRRRCVRPHQPTRDNPKSGAWPSSPDEFSTDCFQVDTVMYAMCVSRLPGVAMDPVHGPGQTETGTAVWGKSSEIRLGGGKGPISLKTGDFNNDGRMDLVVALQYSNSIAVLLATGSGGFSMQEEVQVGSGPVDLDVADLDFDGHPDVAVANKDANNIAVLYGNGKGGFSNAGFPDKYYSIDPKPVAVLLTQFGDRASPYYMLCYNEGVSTYSLYRPHATILGRFRQPMSLDMGSQCREAARFDTNGVFLAACGEKVATIGADFDQDGRMEEATINGDTGAIEVLFSPAGRAQRTLKYKNPNPEKKGGPRRAAPSDLVVADFNNDGWLDIAVANSGSDIVVFLHWDPFTMQFGLPTNFNIDTGFRPMALATGDWDGDGRADLAVANHNSNTVTVYLNIGTGLYKGDSAIASRTCRGSCGAKALHDECYCDLTCTETGDCCEDYDAECSSLKTGGAAHWTASSCIGSCGHRAATCWCQQGCEADNTCCPDFADVCLLR